MIRVEPSLMSPAEEEKYQVGPLAIVNLVSPTQSGCAFEMYELAMGIATVDYHIHRRMDETLYVIEGAIEFNVAGDKFLRPAGSVAFIPRGTHHGFSNLGPVRARVIAVFSPSGNQQEYFRALETLLEEPSPDMGAVHDLQKRYDQELIEPGA